MASMTTTETDEEKFKRVYLTNVADKLSRYFYAHEFGDDVAMECEDTPVYSYPIDSRRRLHGVEDLL